MRTKKYLAPIYGLKTGLKSSIKIDKNIILRNIDLLSKEYKLFEENGLRASYNMVLEINYQFDENDPSEPMPAMSINVINKIDAALLVYGEGVVGVAAIIPASKNEGLPYIISHAKPNYREYLDKEIDEEFVIYYKKFLKAYNMRPIAFDWHRRSQDRFANNDRTIDSCTVLESIFVPKGERSKKSFILSGMKIMGFEKEDVDKIDSLIEYRNAIIHADREKQLRLLSGSKYTFSWFEDTFKLMRKILYNYVEKPWS